LTSICSTSVYAPTAIEREASVGAVAANAGEIKPPWPARRPSRMPVILPREAWSARLGEEPATADDLKALRTPFPAEPKWADPVSKKRKK
jgi:hypothetical protein